VNRETMMIDYEQIGRTRDAAQADADDCRLLRLSAEGWTLPRLRAIAIKAG